MVYKMVICIFLIITGGIFSRAASIPARNVLVIMVDDLRAEIGAYGSETALTPSIDRLAKEGITFRRAYVQQAVCAASRASYLTGMRPESTGVDYPYTREFTATYLEAHPAFHTYFNRHGYWAMGTGKIHHGYKKDLIALDASPFAPGGNPWWQHYASPENMELARRGRDDRSVKTPAYEAADVSDDAYHDGANTSYLIQQLKAAAANSDRQPFFLVLGLLKPHLPFCAPQRYWDLYDPGAFPDIAVPHLPIGATEFAAVTLELPRYAGSYGTKENPVTPEMAEKLRHGYLACVSYIDAQIGRVLDTLEETGLDDNTTVLFMSDHGFHLGEQGMWGKHVNYEHAALSPLIIRAPEVAEPGSQTEALVEFVDVFPTLCELAGLPVPEYLEGDSLVPLMRNPQATWGTAAFHQYPRGSLEGYAVRTERWRYVEWRAHESDEVVARELYDYALPIPEIRNLVDDHPAVAAEHARILAAGWEASRRR